MQLSYYRGESRFSDHRPVCGTFIVEVEVEVLNTKRCSSNADMRIDAEELLQSYPRARVKVMLYLLLALLLFSIFLVQNINKNIL